MQQDKTVVLNMTYFIKPLSSKKASVINEKEKALSELKTLQNKVQECEKQRIDTESKEIKEKIDLTIVIITHQMEVVKDLCNKVAVMQDGKVIEEKIKLFVNQ